MSSAEALTALGGDLTFSLSYVIASELRLGAASSGMSEHELIAIVLLVSVVLSALPPSMRRGSQVLVQAWLRSRDHWTRAAPRRAVFADWILGTSPSIATPAGHIRAKSASLFQFVEQLIAIARRIAMSLLVQLVAASAVANQALRISRVLTLFSVTVFFLFLQSGASAVALPRRE